MYSQFLFLIEKAEVDEDKDDKKKKKKKKGEKEEKPKKSKAPVSSHTFVCVFFSGCICYGFLNVYMYIVTVLFI